MAKKMKQPPLAEAICEFRFGFEAWDWTIPGQLFERIKRDFPSRSQVKSLGIEIKAGGQQPSTTVHTVPERVQFSRKDKSATVQMGPGLLAINRLQPYEDWNEFLCLILATYTHYSEVAESLQLSRIGLRYINRLDTDPSRQAIGDLITLDPPLHGALDMPLNTFHQRYELTNEQPRGILIHQTGIVVSDGAPKIMLDLDFVSSGVPDAEDMPAIKQWLDDAHDCVEAAFIASLNSDLYQRLTG